MKKLILALSFILLVLPVNAMPEIIMGQEQSYSVMFDGEGEATVVAKISIQNLEDNATYNARDKKAELSKLEAMNPSVSDVAWFARRNYYLKPKDFTKQGEYVSEEWNNLYKKGNEARIFCYYNFAGIF